jgi:hypothetical protein
VCRDNQVVQVFSVDSFPSVNACARARPPEIKGRGRPMGAAEFLTKPVDFDLLKVRLRQLPNAADCEAHPFIE